MHAMSGAPPSGPSINRASEGLRTPATDFVLAVDAFLASKPGQAGHVIRQRLQQP
jgi:hypothetical protein